MGFLVFESYEPKLRETALALFDANCPAFFAQNERADFASFLDKIGATYQVALRDGRAVAAFAVAPATPGRARLNWIMVAPDAHGAGLGRAMMMEAALKARTLKAEWLDIAASHLSASFFARFGAVERSFAHNGWGPGMHRVDMEWSLPTSASL